MPAKPRWLLSIPDAISQLEQLDRTLLTRRDIERLSLMQTFGAELVGNQRTLPRTKLLQQLKKHRGPGGVPRGGGTPGPPGGRAPESPDPGSDGKLGSRAVDRGAPRVRLGHHEGKPTGRGSLGDGK